jgi:hypothetical protein
MWENPEHLISGPQGFAHVATVGPEYLGRNGISYYNISNAKQMTWRGFPLVRIVSIYLEGLQKL